MAYLTHNGQYIGSNRKIQYTPVYDLLKIYRFNGVNFGNDYLDIQNSKKISFGLYFESESGWPKTNRIWFWNSDNSSDSLLFFSSGAGFYASAFTPSSIPFFFPLSGNSERNLHFEITKTLDDVSSMTVNGSPTSRSGTYNGSMANSWGLRGPGFGYDDKVFFIWDLKITDDPSGSNTLLHHWKGYPKGDENSSWTDQVGTLNGNIIGNDIDTRRFYEL